MVEEDIKAIVFDFGGVFTLSDAAKVQLRCYDEKLQLPPDTLHMVLFSGEAWEMVSTGRISLETYWMRTGQPYESRLPAEFGGYRHGLFWAEPINEEMVSLAGRLHESYRLALCSNALPELEEILAGRPDLETLFDTRVISVRVGLRKPDPAIFRLTASRLGLPLANCLLIDDKVRNTLAAAQAGMPGIVFESAAQLSGELLARGLLPPE